MTKFVLLSVVLLLAAGSLFAQGVGSMLTGAGEGGAILVNTPKGFFALRSGVLAKYDIATMKPLQVFQLFGAAPAQPAENADREAVQKYNGEIQRRQASSVMIAKDASLIIIIGDGFARINQDTFKVEATADLKAPGATPADNGRGFRMQEPAPGYLLVGTTLYLMRGNEMLSISITDGKILTRSALPKELQPLQMVFPQMGGRGNPRGGPGGNQGDRQPNTPPAQ